MQARRAALAFAGLCVLVAGAAVLDELVATPAAPLASACAEPGPRDGSLFLIGDAGAPRAPEPLLEALVAALREEVAALGAERVAVVFLGDNIYPEGLHAVGHPLRAEDERRLGAQLDVVRRSGARGLFVPGNHDWSNGGPDGWDAVKRQTRYVAARGGTVVPPDGCPGPVTRALGDRLALVALDTQWWLHEFEKPSDDASGCAAAEPGAVEAAIASTLRDAAGRHAIVLAHHPLVTGGPHGTRFGWRQHLFPLREIDRRWWLPLPLVGSAWPLLRHLGASAQDLPGAAYVAMTASLARAFAAATPLAFAAGHDHSLQLIARGPARFQIVSGAGSAPNLSEVHAVDGSLFHAAASGWVRVGTFAGGAVEIEIRRLSAAESLDPYRACLAASF